VKIYRQKEKKKLGKRTFFRKKDIQATNKNGEKELSLKQKVFAREYVKDYNGTHAALRAGYSKTSAHVFASNLLRRSKIRQLIEDHEKNLSTRFANTKEKILKEMSLIAHSDLADYLTPDGEIRVTNLKDLPPQVSRAIKKVRVHTVKRLVKNRVDGEPPDELIEQHIDFELYDKNSALEKMGRELGMFIEKKELTGKDGQPLVPQGSTKIVFDFGVDDVTE